jgi:hypothetical protein
VKGAVRETLFKGLNSIICDLEFTAHLRKLLSAECVTEETDDLLLFLACFIRQFSSEIMTFDFRPEELSCSADGQDEEDIHVSDNDQKVLYLVAGFVVFSIKKKCFQQKNNKTYIKVVKLLQIFIKNNETATKQYVVKHSDWIDKINRGGLVYPADDFFLLVREMENVMRKNINLKKLSSETLMKTVLTQYIMSSYMVHYYWDSLCKDVEDEMKIFVLEMVISVFLTVRSFAVVRFVKAKYEKDNAPNRAEKSLRGVLKTKCKDT